jgi:hypothetical protein
MARRHWRVAVLAVSLSIPGVLLAQTPVSAPPTATAPRYADSPLGVYDAPGNYGVAWGSASFGAPRLYSAFSSPYGAGYGYGYAPYRLMPGSYGAGMWAPGTARPAGSLEGSGTYRVFPVPYGPAPHGEVPPLGAYAPGFGPPAFQHQGR